MPTENTGFREMPISNTVKCLIEFWEESEDLFILVVIPLIENWMNM